MSHRVSRTMIFHSSISARVKHGARNRCSNSGLTGFAQRIRIKTAEKELLIMDFCGTHFLLGFKGDSQIEMI